ncbi:DUF4876 domain-containing protein [Arcticibacter tournemirensis]|uniref:DUF4876 domain-containing protein n=1 Tax=Arcticibacter tournemirensis TaxID=699437 RepID=A0A4Q0MFK6_9SPHI|nr:DUF4876 domain-containing protein [Arcticibacter tournemirensis]RXF72280.1 DUF4876 domain-containing protein [Arcticibacter tournemirensis]
MKKLFYLVCCTIILCYSCKKDNDYPTTTVTVQLAYPAGSEFTAKAGVAVKMTGRSTSFDAVTDAAGKATFVVPTDVYDISATDTRTGGSARVYIYSAVKSGVTISTGGTDPEAITLELQESETSQIIIKELYVGGVPKDDGSGPFQYDRYTILYNNSNTAAHLGNLCLATTIPYNAQASNPYYGTDGRLTYESEGWIPAGQAFWYFREDVVIQPGQQIVIALANAVNNTLVHSKSINFNNPAYYCTFDNTKFTHAATYPAPSASIPSSHYLKAETYAPGSAWTLSNTSPGFFIFDPQGYTPSAFAADLSKTDQLNSALISKKVNVKWVLDGVDAFLLNNTGNKKRLTATVDAGYVYHLNGQGYSIYRNVDAAATKAIEGNEAKLVYNYAYGTTAVGGTTDPSGIDAEASIKNGARIIYKDTNNSTNDFHLRSQASLRN